MLQNPRYYDFSVGAYQKLYILTKSRISRKYTYQWVWLSLILHFSLPWSNTLRIHSHTCSLGFFRYMLTNKVISACVYLCPRNMLRFDPSSASTGNVCSQSWREWESPFKASIPDEVFTGLMSWGRVVFSDNTRQATSTGKGD